MANGIQGEMPSPGSPPEWGSFGSKAGEGLEREWRGMGHSEQGTSVSLIDVAKKYSVVSM